MVGTLRRIPYNMTLYLLEDGKYPAKKKMLRYGKQWISTPFTKHSRHVSGIITRSPRLLQKKDTMSIYFRTCDWCISTGSYPYTRCIVILFFNVTTFFKLININIWTLFQIWSTQWLSTRCIVNNTMSINMFK